jgi:hypothetical protein
MARNERLAWLFFAVWLALGSTGCVSFSWERGLRYEPPDPEVLAGLEPGHTTLDLALDQLGAPLWVWEYPSEDGAGAALAYGWYQSRERGIKVKAPTNTAVSPSFSYNRIDSRMQGLVLFFDQDWRLDYWREGLLVDLTAELTNRRPAYLEHQRGANEAPSVVSVHSAK